MFGQSLRRVGFPGLAFAACLAMPAPAEPLVSRTEKTLSMHQDGIWDVEVSPNGQWLATAGGDGIIKIWNASTLQLKTTLVQNDLKFQIYDVDFLPDGERIIATQLAGPPVIWNFKTGQKLAELNGHEEMVVRAAVSPDGKIIYTAGADGKVLAWSCGTNSYQVVGSMKFKSPVGLAPQKETGVTVIAGLDGIIIADVINDQVLKPITRIERFSTAIRTANNTTLAVGAVAGNSSPQRINSASGDLEPIYAGISDEWGWNIAAASATKHHGPLVAVAYYKSATAVWDTTSKALLFKSPTDTWQSLSVGFSPLGDRLYIGDTQGSLHVYALTNSPSSFVSRTQ